MSAVEEGRLLPVMIEREAFRCCGSAYELAIYCTLCFLEAEAARDGEDVQVGSKRLADLCGVGRTKTIEVLRLLERRGAIVRHHMLRDAGNQDANVYRVRGWQ